MKTASDSQNTQPEIVAPELPWAEISELYSELLRREREESRRLRVQLVILAIAYWAILALWAWQDLSK